MVLKVIKFAVKKTCRYPACTVYADYEMYVMRTLHICKRVYV